MQPLELRAGPLNRMRTGAPLTLGLVLCALALGGWSVFFGATPGLVLAGPEGGWWTLFSGPLLHLSPTHYLLDLGALLIIGLLYEPGRRRSFLAAYVVITLLVAGTFWLVYPQLDGYYGMSSHAHGLLAFGVLANRRRQPWMALLVMAVLLGKGALEVLFPLTQFGMTTRDLSLYGQPVPWAHLAGVAGGLLVGWRAARGSTASMVGRSTAVLRFEIRNPKSAIE